MSLIPAAEVKRSQARSATDAHAVTAEALAAEALIAEARAHARRRRLKIAVALAILAAVVAAVLIGRVTIGSHRAAQARPRPAALAAGTGIVTGHLAACFGIAADERASHHSRARWSPSAAASPGSRSDREPG